MLPPGHHATSNKFGGYCILNNAAIAAEALTAGGASRVSYLDVNFQHGNGTQEIFWTRNDLLFLSLHGTPEHANLHYSGGADEKGEGDGLGFNHNFPLPPGTDFAKRNEALSDVLILFDKYSPDYLIVSLGFDKNEDDTFSFFLIKSLEILRFGETICHERRL